MINLLPYDSQKEIKRAYYLRVFTVAFYLLGIVCLLAFAFLVPSYWLTLNKESAIAEKLAGTTIKVAESEEELRQSIDDINKKLLVFSGKKDPLVFSRDVLTEIITRSNNELSLTSFSMSQDKDKKGVEKTTLSVGGISRNREALIKFEKALKEQQRFKNVAVPVSNLVQGSNIAFTIQFTFE